MKVNTQRVFSEALLILSESCSAIQLLTLLFNQNMYFMHSLICTLKTLVEKHFHLVTASKLDK